MKTTLFKDVRNGWEATTTIELNDKQTMSITTRRDFEGYLKSRAMVHWVSKNGTKRHTFGGGANSDFSYIVKASRPIRITQKVVQEQHEQALTVQSQMKELALQFYARPDSPKADELFDKLTAEA